LKSAEMTLDSQKTDGPAFSISGTPTITSEKLNEKNYLAWSASVFLAKVIMNI